MCRRIYFFFKTLRVVVVNIFYPFSSLLRWFIVVKIISIACQLNRFFVVKNVLGRPLLVWLWDTSFHGRFVGTFDRWAHSWKRPCPVTKGRYCRRYCRYWIEFENYYICIRLWSTLNITMYYSSYICVLHASTVMFSITSASFNYAL